MSDDQESLGEEAREVAAGESEIIHDLGKGAFAGIVATVPVALILVAKQIAGYFPQLDLVGMLTGMTGIPWSGTGWVLLFVVGAVLGMGFASLDSHVSDATEAGEMVRGGFFGFLVWVLLLLVMIPLYGNEGFGVAFAGGLLGTSLVFGVVMGVVYERTKPEHVS